MDERFRIAVSQRLVFPFVSLLAQPVRTSEDYSLVEFHSVVAEADGQSGPVSLLGVIIILLSSLSYGVYIIIVNKSRVKTNFVRKRSL